MCQIWGKMSKSNEPTYDSQRDRENYTFHPGRQFHLLWNTDPGPCYLLALDHRQLALLREMCAVFPKYHWVWGLPSPRKDWDAQQTQTWADITDFVEELEVTLLGGCDLQAFIDATIEQTKAIRELTAVVGSLNLDLTEPVPDNVDYSGAADGLAGKFRTSNWIAPDQNLADILANSLFGRYLDIPNPLEGTGISDILDEQIDVLHNRFRMSDSSIWNLFGEKNITETLETLFRIDAVFDLELLTNITSVLDRTFNTGDSTVLGLLKNLARRITNQLKLPPEVQTWLEDKLDVEERLSAADILLMLATAGGEEGMQAVAKAIKEAQHIINLNNYNGCCGEEDCDCGQAETKTLTLEDLGCEEEDTVVNLNGTC